MGKKLKITLAIIVVLLIAFRLYLPTLVKNYTNKALNDIPGYYGSVEDVDLHLYRGATKVHGMQLFDSTSTTDKPLFGAKTIDASIEWSALFDGAIVAEIILIEPTVNMVGAKKGSPEDEQFGEDVDWTKQIQDIMPINVNRFEIKDGTVHYYDFTTQPKVDVRMDDMQMVVTNLRNTIDSETPLPSSVKMSAITMGGGRFSVDGNLNILKQIPDVDISMKLEKMDIPAINDFAKAYASMDIEKGKFNLYNETVIKDGQLEGYVKPIIEDLKILSFKNDKPIKKPLNFLWQATAGLVAELFENQPKSSFGTKVPIRGDLNNVKPNIWTTTWNIVKHAFFKAFDKNTEGTVDFSDIKID